MKNQLDSTLGNFYSAPPDGRLPLAFESNRLRQACEDGTLPEYLSKVGRLLASLHKIGGLFMVSDIDDFMGTTDYTTWVEPISSYVCNGFVAEHALQAEEFHVNIPPGLYHIKRPHQLDPLSPLGPSGYATGWGVPRSREWHRVIQLQGLAYAPFSGGDVQQTPQKLREERAATWLLLFDHSHPCFDIVKRTFRLHILCSPRQDLANPYLGSWEPFHIAWYRILWAEKKMSSVWKSGSLYRTDHVVEQNSFTFAVFPGDFVRVRYTRANMVRSYWTTLILSAPYYARTEYDGCYPFIAVLLSVRDALRTAVTSWQEIDKCLSEMLVDDEDTVLNPDNSDRLLFDDNTFSRSRRYFWAINMLGTFRGYIRDSIVQWKYWWVAWENVVRGCEKEQWERAKAREQTDLEGRPFITTRLTRDGQPYSAEVVDDILPKIESQIAELEHLESRFQGYLERMEKLRDGVSTIFAVMRNLTYAPLPSSVYSI
jgi:hypothetical protein